MKNTLPKDYYTVKDKLLWSLLQEGDDGVYAFIYKKYAQSLFSYGMKFSTNRAIVQDCIQDVFVKIYNNRSTLSGTDNIQLYLFIALKNSLFNVFQKTKDQYHIDTIEPIFYTDYTIEQKLIDEELDYEIKQKVLFMLESLSPRQREIIHYRFIEGMTVQDICQIMDMNYQSVQNLLQRSIKRIRNVFSEEKQTKLSVKFSKRNQQL